MNKSRSYNPNTGIWKDEPPLTEAELQRLEEGFKASFDPDGTPKMVRKARLKIVHDKMSLSVSVDPNANPVELAQELIEMMNAPTIEDKEIF